MICGQERVEGAGTKLKWIGKMYRKEWAILGMLLWGGNEKEMGGDEKIVFNFLTN